MLKNFFWLLPPLLGVSTSLVSAQLTVQETLRECGVSSESLAVAGCTSTHALSIVEELADDQSTRVSLEQLQGELTAARSRKLELLQSLAEAETEDIDQLQIDLQAASDHEAAALLAYQRAIDSTVQQVVGGAPVQQQVLLQLAIRSNVRSLPAEYRVLPWSGRKLGKLARALKLDSAESHPLVIEAESVYDVQLARQYLLNRRDEIAVAINEQ